MKKQISIYHRCYLPLSQTFIHRQLQGLERYFDLRVFTHGIENKDEFSGIDPVVIPQPGLLHRLLGGHKRIIREQLRGSSLFHVNFGHFALAMQQHARAAGIPITAYFLGADASAYLRDPAYCHRLRQSKFDSVFVNSQDMKRRLVSHLPPDTSCNVVYCGIPLERFPFRQRRAVSDGAVFLQVSRLDPKKGIDVTLKAFRRYLRETDPRARLVVAGDGPLRTDLLQLSDALGLQGKVSFLGPIGYQRYIELLHSADVFIHPSHTAADGDMEGLPTAICEAMACGLPVVSTLHSGIPELVDDGENGYLAQERDDAGIFDSMVLLRNSDIAAMSRSARLKIESRFDHDKNISMLADHMNRILQGGVLEL